MFFLLVLLAPASPNFKQLNWTDWEKKESHTKELKINPTAKPYTDTNTNTNTNTITTTPHKRIKAHTKKQTKNTNI